MDERHWWFASKLQETFHFGGYDNPTVLEDFLSDPDVVDLINEFLAPGEPCKVFFYCDEPPSDGSRTPSASRRLHATSELTIDAVNRGQVCLYVLRAHTDGEVQAAQMERELFCGELRHSVLSSLASLLSEAYNPLLHSLKHWGECSDAAVTNFLQNFDKYSSNLLEAATISQTQRPLLLRPSLELRAELQILQTRSVLSVDTVCECEGLVGEWINSIEGLLLEATDERMENPWSSPLSELSKWRQRHSLLTAVVEQLKVKEARAMFTVLVAAKSRMLKKWKATDTQLTDAFNNARDRVRYLESLSPHLEALEASPSLPSLLSSLIPSISTGIKQMEGLSRAYARSGYLSILLTKIANALVRICTASLQTYCTGRDDQDLFWDVLSSVVQTKLKPGPARVDHPFLTQLSLCLQVASVFKETLHHLKDVLIAQHRVNFSSPSSYSVGPSTVSLTGTKRGSGNTPTNPLVSSNRGGSGTRKGRGRLTVPALDKRNLPSFPGSGTLSVSGVGLQQADIIAANMNEFSSRVMQVIEIVSTLAQFRTLVGNIRGLPRVPGLLDQDSVAPVPVSTDDDGSNERGIPIPEGSVRASDYLERVFGRREYPLPPLGETGREEKTEVLGDNREEDTREILSTPNEQDTSLSLPPPSSPHPPTPPPTTDSIAHHIHTTLTAISSGLTSSCPRGVQDVFTVDGRGRTVFQSMWDMYSSQVTSLEKNIADYLRTVISQTSSSKDALDIIARFAGVSDCGEVQGAVQASYTTAFKKYATELDTLHASYESNKGCPPISHSLPPIAGSLSWCREMLDRVAGPMKTFRGNSALMQSVASLEVCKLHNQLSTALLQYEMFLITRWHGAIEAAQRALGLPLFVQETNEKDGTFPHIKVNCQRSLLDVMAESKALSTAGVSLPEVTRHILTQESRVKQFRQSLQQVLDDFYSTQSSLDRPLQTLLHHHIDRVIRSLLPGCSSLTWSTLNIDAFLHHATSAVSVFQTTASRIQSILQEHVYSVLKDIAGSSLYDVELANSRLWFPRDFSDAIKNSAVRRSSNLRRQVSAIKRAVLVCIMIANGRMGEEDGEGEMMASLKSNLLLAGVSKEESRSKGESSSSRRHVSKQQSMQSMCMTTTSSSHGGGRRGEGGRGEEGEDGEEDVRTREVGEAGEDTLSHVCGLVFNAVCKMIARSHSQMSAGLGGAEEGRQETSPEVVVGRLSRSFVDLTGQKTVRFQYSQTVDNPRAVFADFAHRFDSVPPLKLEAQIQLSVPRIHMEPRLSDIHVHLAQVTSVLLSVLHKLSWWAGPGAGREFHVIWDASGAVDHMHNEILERFRTLEPAVDGALLSLRLHDFLWREDMHAAYQAFLDSSPTQSECCRHIERFTEVENTLKEIPAVHVVGPLQLSYRPVIHSLTALAVAWKLEYAKYLHYQAQMSLQALVDDRERMSHTLGQAVESLAQLRECLQLLLDIQDLQNTIDDQYTPLEQLYSLLRRYTPSLPRSEVTQVDSLRGDWEALVELADATRQRLLHEHRHIHERETEKQVREFQMETIRFRNSFDTEGPLVPGLTPQAAIVRLESFSQQCEELQTQRHLLCSVQTLLSLPISPYPELDYTHTDIVHLNTLYCSYHNFLAFEEKFRQTLWQDTDLVRAGETLERLWANTSALPPKQQEWAATHQLRTDICHYRDLLPLLTRLHSREVRNRHWLQVMRVTNCTFQLEGSVFKLAHLLEASLLTHEEEIEKIVSCALKELELETEFRAIEEHWNEQILQFVPYKALGEVLLDVDHTHFLCKGLESAGVRLAVMLVSAHVTHLRDEVVQWAGRLSRVEEFLTQWLAIQQQWRQLHSVLTASSTAFHNEIAQFETITESWVKLMTSARASPGVVEWCDEGEGGRGSLLGGLRERMELCKQSLSLLLLSKREAFPRFFYVSDNSLLEILSSPVTPSSLTPHLPSIFTNTRSLVTSSSSGKDGDDPMIITAVESAEEEYLELKEPVRLCGGVEDWASLLLSSLRSSLSSLLLASDSSTLSVEEMAAGALPCQVVGLTIYLRWTRDTELALSQCRYDRRALPGLRSKFTSSVIGKLTHLLMRGRSRVGDGTRQRLESLAMLAVWLRDIIDDLCHHKLRSVTDFEWQRYPRLCATFTDEQQMKLQMQCLYTTIEYGFEYFGCQSMPVFTPRMNNYMLSLMQGMECGQHSMVCGPQTSGKVDMVQGIARLLGRFLFIYSCTSHSNTHTLARILEGLARDGGWACMRDVDTLPRCVLSVVCHMIEAVSTALSHKQTVYKTPSGREACLQPGMLVVFTSSRHPRSWTLPPSLSPLFRTFSLPPLDPAVFLLATCTALGLRGPRQLACKLTALHHMANHQLKAGLPLGAVSRVLREVRGSKLKPVASIPHHKSEGARSDTRGGGGGRSTTEEHSHRHLTGPSATKEAHRGQKTISLMTTPPSSQPLPPLAAREHASIAQLLAVLLAPRFNTREQPVFLDMVKSAFAPIDHSTQMVVGVASHLQAPPTSELTEGDVTIDSVLSKVIEKAGLVAKDTWMAKVKEILTMARLTKRHLILTGAAGIGKTTALDTAASALNMLPNQRSKVNIHRVYPGAFDDISTLIGRFSTTGAWEDGVCLSLIRKGLKATSLSYWVVLDGRPDHNWLHPLTELLSDTHTLCLPNGEWVVGGDKCGLRLVLETGNLTTISPASLDTCGVVFFDTHVLSWQPLIEVWLQSRPGVERSCLKKQFVIFLEPVTKMVCCRNRDSAMYSEVGLTRTCLGYLTPLLNIYSETTESFSAIHVVRLLVFSIIWSFGAVLQPGTERHSFSHLLKSLTNSLPDDDSQHSVYDYYVDESGEWDVWQTRLPPPSTLTATVGLLGNVYVDTTDSVRVELLLELALSARRPVLLTGPQGSGKTTICKHFLQDRALSHVTSEGVCHLSLDSHTSSSSLHHFMNVFMHHRQGNTYSPQDHKTLHLFIDDLHLPHSSETTPTSAQITPPSCHEYIRQLIDCRGVHNLGKKNTFSAIEDLSLFTALTTASTTHSPLSPRLSHHFTVIHLPELADTPLTTILTESLRTLCGGVVAGSEDGMEGSEDGTPRPWISGETMSCIVQSTMTVFLRVRDSLRASEMPGRQHYVFNLSHIQCAFQGLYHCLSSPSSPGLGLSWYHEMTRSLAEPICRSADHHWITTLIHSHAEKLPGGLPSPLPLCLTAVPVEIKKGEEKPPLETTPINQLPEVELHPLSEWDDMEMSLNLFLMRCRQDWGDFPLSLSTNNMHCIIRLHRALKFPRGNSILCGPRGQQLHSVAKLSLYLAGYQLCQLDSSSPQTFRSSLRALFRRAGLEGRPVGVVLTENDVESVEIVQKLNSLCATGELPTLFTNDEMNGILQALAPSIKKDFSSEETHPMQYLTARIARYLRLVLCLSPSFPLLGTLAHSFRGLLSGCHVMWMAGWSEEELSHSLSHFFSTSPLTVPVKKSIRSPLYRCLSGIHRLVLKQSGHLELAGHFPSALPSPLATGQETASALTSFPLLMEKVLKIERDLGSHNSNTGFAGEFQLPYVGPLTFLGFLENFCTLYSRKKSELKSEENRLKKAVETLRKTSQKVSSMRDTLISCEKEHTAVQEQFLSLLLRLTQKSCVVERVKAVLGGGGSSVISAMQMTADQEKAMAEDDQNDDETLAVLLGASLGKKASRAELQLEKARERELEAEAEEREAREAIITEKEEVQHYEDSIDRNAIDQIKSLPNPPAVVCTVIQVMLTLLRQHRRDGGTKVGGTMSEDSLQSGGPTGSQYSGHSGQRRTSIFPPSSTAATSIIAGTTLPSSHQQQNTREQWKTIKLAIGDSQNFRDLVTELHWRDGLTIEAVNHIKGHLEVDSTGKWRRPSVGEEEGVTTTSQPTTVTFAAARHAAEVVGVVFGFAVGMVKYTAVYHAHRLAVEKLRRARERVLDLQGQVEGAVGGGGGGGGKTSGPTETPELAAVLEEEEMETEVPSEDGLQKLQDELRVVQVAFNESAVKKHTLDQTCSQLSEGLKSSTHLMESLHSRKEAWQSRLDHAPSQQLLITNCLLAAAITTYCAPYSTLSRNKLYSAMVDVCKEHGLLAESDTGQLLRLEQYPLFMLGQPALNQLVIEGLPPDHTSQQSACMITCSHAHCWPLVCDPFGMASEWMCRHGEQKTAVVELQSPNLHSTLLTALTAGTPLIVTGVNGESVTGDGVMMSLLWCRQHLRDATDPPKIKIGDKEVDYKRNFKMWLVTGVLPEALPPELVAMTTTVLFWPEVGGLEGLFLDRFLWQQNGKIAQERHQLRKEVYSESVRGEEAERQLLAHLSRGSNLDDHHSARDLLQINASYEDAMESLTRVQEALRTMSRVQLSALSALASRAALISSVVMTMGISFLLYATSYNYVVSVFLSLLEQAGSHVQGTEAVERLTQYGYHHFSRGMLQNERLLFAFTLVLQIELNVGPVTLHEISYLLHPTPGTEYAVRGLAAQARMDLHDATPVSIGKRPYDWILESQWQAMLMLMSHFPWAQKNMRLAFAEDAQGLQALFRSIFQSKHPELYIAAGIKRVEEKALKDGRNLIHLLLLNSGNRPDRMFRSFQVISETVLLPSKGSYDMPVELYKFYKSCSSEKIPLVIYHDDPHLPTNQIRALAEKLHVPLTVICVHGTGERELEAIVAAMAHTSSEGGWLLLHNIQASPELVDQLPKLLRSHPASEDWKLWLSIHAGSDLHVDSALLNTVCRVVLDTPSSLLSSLLYNLHSLPPDLLGASSRVEWLPLLHSCLLLYAVLRARGEIHTISWTSCPPFPHTLLTDVLQYLQRVAAEASSQVPVSWSGIRHMMAEVFFGSGICDPVDLCTLTSLIEAWIHPGGPRKESGLYHIPAVFFTPGTRLSVLCQGVESATPPPIVSPEICDLNPSPEIKIGCLEKFLPALASLVSVLHQHAPPTGTDHAHRTYPLQLGRAEELATRHLLTPPGPILEKLPSWVHVPYHITELNLDKSQIPILQDIGSTDVWNLKRPLETAVKKIQDILPHGWKEEVLSEKLQRHNSSASFHHFIARETSDMAAALQTIHSSLLSLLQVLDPHAHGDPHTLTGTPHLSHISQALLTNTVPALWLDSVGPTAAPPNWLLGEWVQDLSLRWVFIDHVLSLGMAKVPTYWLGAFFHPEAFLSAITQSVLQSQCSVSGATENTFFLAEVTTRNKDHIRDPPPEGELFVFGSYMWGCRLERSATIEFLDSPPKQQSPTPLPLLHLALTTPSDDHTTNEASGGMAKGAESKANMTYQCPVFVNHRGRRDGERGELFRLLVHNHEVPPTRWAVRSISCTLRPF